MRFLPRLAAAFLLVASARADSVWLDDVSFAVTYDAGPGNAVFVAGSAPQLGAWDTARAVKLEWFTGHIWRGTVALPRGVATTWRPFVRGESAAATAAPAILTWISPDATLTPPAPPPAPHRGKTIYYITGWTTPHILWRSPGGEWTTTPLRPVRPGLFVLENAGTPGRPLEFAPNDGANQWDNPGGASGVNYFARADAVWLRDGQLYDDEPPVTVSAPRFVETTITSSFAGIPSRRVRVLLPRGYDQNTAKVYPVLYCHDGQNVFDPGEGFGSWSVDAIVTRDTAAGLLREMIVVAVDNTGASRINEYRPPGDIFQSASGLGDRYRDFLVNNVKPWVDANFRVSPRREDHALVGSSLGGLITHYIGLTSDVFGLLGVCSPSYWIAPNFRDAIAAGPQPDRRLWLDWGTAESSSMWDYGWPAARVLAGQGLVHGRDLQVMVGVGDAHNEAAWRRRLPDLLRFLLPVTDGPNDLLLAHHGAPSTRIVWQSGTATVQVPAWRGFRYELQSKFNLRDPDWTPLTERNTADPWSMLDLPDTTASHSKFYRVHID